MKDGEPLTRQNREFRPRFSLLPLRNEDLVHTFELRPSAACGRNQRGWPQRHRGTEKARASEEHSAGSIDASVFDAASSVIPADGDVVSSLEDLVAPSGNGKCFRNSVSLCLCGHS